MQYFKHLPLLIVPEKIQMWIMNLFDTKSKLSSVPEDPFLRVK